MANETQASPEELAAMQAAQAEVLAAQAEEIAALKRDLAAAAAGQPKVVVAANAPRVKLGKDTYIINHGVLLPVGGALKKFTAAELAANKEVCEQLLENGTTALLKV